MGSGGFSQVFQATDPDTNAAYAIKVLDFDMEGGSGWVNSLETYEDRSEEERAQVEIDRDEDGQSDAKDFREIRMFLSGLKSGHENVVALEAFGTHTLGYAMLLECCDVGNLFYFTRLF